MYKQKLVFIVCMLFIATTFVSVSGKYYSEKGSPVSFGGTTLYVGGVGPNNYTSIQDAIDVASPGDTVFVYHDSSPYYENIVINKLITMVGEDPETTVIFGDESLDGVIVNISADDVSFSGFTVQPYLGQPTGIVVYKNYVYPDYWNIEVIQNVSIFNNIIRETGWAGIFTIRLNQGLIYDNFIEDSYGNGILLFISSDNLITHNEIVDSDYRGIQIDGLWSQYRLMNTRNPVSENNVISFNTITSNRWGIDLSSGPINTLISDNIITNSHGMFPGQDGIGIDLNGAIKTRIIRNNFIDNSINAHFGSANPIRYPQFLQNSWDNNYWGEPKDTPVRIDGVMYIVTFPRLPVSVSFPNYEFNFHEIAWLAFDRHPAQEPYVIPISG